MLITPIISGGIPEIPVIEDGLCLGPIIIPFAHYPSKALSDKMYIRIIFPKSKLEYQYPSSSIKSPLIFKLAQKNDDNEVYTFDNIKSQTKVETSFTITANDIIDIDNKAIKFLLSYDGTSWSPAVSTKCIKNPTEHLTMIHKDLGFEFSYNATAVGTKLSQLTIETDAKEKKKLNIQDIDTVQTAFCILNSISTEQDFQYRIVGTTVGGYSFMKNFTIANWEIVAPSEPLRITTPTEVEGIRIYNYDASGILCHRVSGEEYWKPLTNLEPPYIYIDNNIVLGKLYEYQILTTNISTKEPAAVKFMLLNNDTEINGSEATGIIAPYQETVYLQDIPDKENKGELKTLYIEYNPQISNLKRVIQEQKVETIGNQYPIFVRNGHINYHEFSIGGLISYLMDPILTEGNVSRTGFYTKAEWSEILNKEQSTNLTSENIQREVLFRNDVINWLTDGKDKEFYSPTEGRMKVHLTNIQLTPETKLGRMIYSFTALATEVGEIK